MYYPYFRGKQFELIAIRDTAELMAEAQFTPIIEPVKAQLKGLQRALDSVCTAGGSVIVVVNPEYGDHAEDGEEISTLLRDNYLELDNVYAGLLLTELTSVNDAVVLYKSHKEHQPVFIHAGFMEAKALAEEIGDGIAKTRHVFFEQNCKKLYRKR